MEYYLIIQVIWQKSVHCTLYILEILLSEIRENINAGKSIKRKLKKTIIVFEDHN